MGLARTARENLGATWGLSETGAAGPGGNGYGDAAGHSCLAVSGPVEMAFTLETASPDRAANMEAFGGMAPDLAKLQQSAVSAMQAATSQVTAAIEEMRRRMSELEGETRQAVGGTGGGDGGTTATSRGTGGRGKGKG